MGYIEIPNLPRRPVRVMLADGRICSGAVNGLRRLGIDIIRTDAHRAVYEAISYHPDIMLHHLGGERFVYAPGTPSRLLEALTGMGFILVRGESLLSGRYPGTIAYNVARVGNLAFHCLKYTDPVLKDELVRLGVELVNVNQGYSKCTVSVVDERSIITSDAGIAKAAEAKGVDVLLIEPGENIMLEGFNEGFIGGCTGLVDRYKWAIAGNIRLLRSADRILSFLGTKGFEAVSLYDGPVMDIGSMLPVIEERGHTL